MEYKVGDKVRVVANDAKHGFDFGYVGIVTRIDEADKIETYLIDDDWWCSETDLEPVTRMEAGKKYQTRKGEYECLFVVDDVAYCVGGKGHTAYTWDANTGKALCLSDGWDIDLTPKPVVETRKGLVVFTDGFADWDSWTEVE